MEQAEIDKRIKELRAQAPSMFSRPELREGEICIGHWTIESAIMAASIHKEAGMLSARVSISAIPGTLGVHSGGERNIRVGFHHVFVSQREFVLAEHALASKQDKRASAKV